MTLERTILGKGHVSVVGITDSGKTTLAEFIHANTLRKSIFLNAQDEVSVKGRRVEGGDWSPAILAEVDHVNLVPDDDPDAYVALVEQVRKDLFDMGRRIQSGRGRRNQWCVVFVDEAHEVAPEGQRTSPLHRLIKRAKRHGIIVVVITQAPADLAKGVLKQCATHVVFRTGRYEATYFQTYNLPQPEQPLEGHQFLVATADAIQGPYVLGRGGARSA